MDGGRIPRCLLGNHLVVLQVNQGIQTQTFADGANGGGVGAERIGNVLTCGQVVGFIREFATAYVFRGGNIGAFFLHSGGNGADQFFNRGFRPFHVEYDKSFVISHSLVILKMCRANGAHLAGKEDAPFMPIKQAIFMP